jgi:hypothetical protein
MKVYSFSSLCIIDNIGNNRMLQSGTWIGKLSLPYYRFNAKQCNTILYIYF